MVSRWAIRLNANSTSQPSIHVRLLIYTPNPAPATNTSVSDIANITHTTTVRNINNGIDDASFESQLSTAIRHAPS